MNSGALSPMISVENLHYSRYNQQIFQKLSLRIDTGDKVLFSGRSGSGKTSLFKLLLGFDRPDSGRIHINQMTLNKKTIKSIRNSIFYLSQDVDLPDEPVMDLLDRTLFLNALPALLSDQLDLFLGRLALSQSILPKTVSQLSGGERQRVGMLLCFILNRPIWLLDEPSSALDRRAKSELVSQVAKTQNTVLIISHDPEWLNLPALILKEF